MDQADATSHTGSTDTSEQVVLADFQGLEIDTRLFNDVHFGRAARLVPSCDVWAPFPRLPAELRLKIWMHFLRRHRMIEVSLYPPDDDDASTYPDDPGRLADLIKSRYYRERNSLGNLVSGRRYKILIDDNGFAASLNPLLWVNAESRQTALDFYRIHLPFPGLDGKQLLYLNPEFDVVSVQEVFVLRGNRYTSRAGAITIDFLCDIRAYDPRHKGLANLILPGSSTHSLFDHEDYWCFNYEIRDRPRIEPFTLDLIHPVAVTSFSAILRSGLRSVVCNIPFRSPEGTRDFTFSPPGDLAIHPHFAWTHPLRRRGIPVGAFDWFETDPRPGVEMDNFMVNFTENPYLIASSWKKLEEQFGIRERANDDGFHLYISPTLRWELEDEEPENRVLFRTLKLCKWSRAALLRHLGWEAKVWAEQYPHIGEASDNPGPFISPGRSGTMGDATNSGTLDTVPRTAIGMWLFPVEAFNETNVRYAQDNGIGSKRSTIFDLSAIRPALYLFELGD